MAFNIDSFKARGLVISGKKRDTKMLGEYEPGEVCFATRYGPIVLKEKYYLFNGVRYEYPEGYTRLEIVRIGKEKMTPGG